MMIGQKCRVLELERSLTVLGSDETISRAGRRRPSGRAWEVVRRQVAETDT